MRTRIVRIGNSQGIRIPKPLLEQAGLDGDVELVLEDGVLIVKPAQARQGWDAAFQAMAEEGADRPLDASDGTRFDDEEWTW
jgi:antitoxin MazE